jgi:hypothetical protein
MKSIPHLLCSIDYLPANFFPALKSKKVMMSTALLLFIGFTGLQAQNTIPAAGGNAAGSGGTAVYTIGQFAYTTINGADGSVAQGVEQPYEILVVTGTEELSDISLEILVYPNPAADFIKLIIEHDEVLNLRYQLFNSNGSILQDKKVEGSETSIAVGSLVAAIYYLKVIQGSKKIKTFKIIKN